MSGAFDPTDMREISIPDEDLFENNDLDTALELRSLGLCDGFTDAILKGGFDSND